MNSVIRALAVTFTSLPLLASCASERLVREASRDFDQGSYELAIGKLQQAVSAAPGNQSNKIDLLGRTAEAVQRLVAAGDKARSSADYAAADAAYRRVLTIEPGNSRAKSGLDGVEADRRHAQLVVEAQTALASGDVDVADARLRKVLEENPGYAPATALRQKVDAARGPVTVSPRLKTRDNRPVTLQFRDAQTKMVFEVLSRQTGINFIFDKDVRSDGKTTIFVQDVPIDRAIELVLGQNQLARQVLSENMVLIYPNTAAKQKEYQDQIVRTFYLNTAAPKDVETLLKTVLDVKTLVVNERANSLTMRDTPETVRMAEKLVASVDLAEPEVMLEVEVLEITRSKLMQLGVKYPSQVNLNLPSNLVLNDYQYITGDDISVSDLSVTLDALKTNSDSNVLASPRIRVRNKEKAKVLIGSRVPVITSTASASGNGGVVTNAQVQYLDVGLTLDVEPNIYTDNDVAIKMNLEVSSITKRVDVGDTLAYEIGTRNATTLLQLRDGETQILAGLIQDSDTRSASKIPGLGDIPIVGRLFSDHGNDKSKTEVVLSITPRIIRAKGRPSSETTEFWYGTESRTGLAPLGAGIGDGTAKAGGTGAITAPSNVSSNGAATVVGAPAAAAATAATSDTASGRASSASRFGRFRGAGGVVAPQTAADGSPAPQLTAVVEGPADAKVGDEFTVTLKVSSDQDVARIRGQLRFDVAGFQLVSGDPGGYVASMSDAKVASFAGGAQIDATAAEGQAFSGGGDLMVLHFKAQQARPQAAFAGQITAMNPSGAVAASTASTPLMMSVVPN
jgi:general secretion pathway protein D